jgi:hypothetical protein
MARGLSCSRSGRDKKCTFGKDDNARNFSAKHPNFGGGRMTIKGAIMSEAAWALWERRNAALEASAQLMSEKPDIEEWTKEERRIWTYALAIGRRLERLH